MAAVAEERSAIRPPLGLIARPVDENRAPVPPVMPIVAELDATVLVPAFVRSIFGALFVLMTGALVPIGREIEVPFCGHGRALVK